jgi:hypothetical protein
VADENISTVRIVGAAVSIASKTMSNPSSGLIVAAAILQGIGLTPLLLATLGFVTKMRAILLLFRGIYITSNLLFFFTERSMGSPLLSKSCTWLGLRSSLRSLWRRRAAP